MFRQSLSPRHSTLLVQWIAHLLPTSHGIFSFASLWKHFLKPKDKFFYILLLYTKRSLPHVLPKIWFVLRICPFLCTLSNGDIVYSWNQWSWKEVLLSFYITDVCSRPVQISSSFNDHNVPGYYLLPLLCATTTWCSPCQPTHSIWRFVISLLLPPTPASLIP